MRTGEKVFFALLIAVVVVLFIVVAIDNVAAAAFESPLDEECGWDAEGNPICLPPQPTVVSPLATPTMTPAEACLECVRLTLTGLMSDKECIQICAEYAPSAPPSRPTVSSPMPTPDLPSVECGIDLITSDGEACTLV